MVRLDKGSSSADHKVFRLSTILGSIFVGPILILGLNLLFARSIWGMMVLFLGFVIGDYWCFLRQVCRAEVGQNSIVFFGLDGKQFEEIRAAEVLRVSIELDYSEYSYFIHTTHGRKKLPIIYDGSRHILRILDNWAKANCTPMPPKSKEEFK